MGHRDDVQQSAGYEHKDPGSGQDWRIKICKSSANTHTPSLAICRGLVPASPQIPKLGDAQVPYIKGNKIG